MTKPHNPLNSVEKSTAESKIASLLTPCLLNLPDRCANLCERETKSLLALSRELTEPLLEKLSIRCADVYEIHNYMRELLDDERYLECHHVLMLLYAACRQIMPRSVVIVACYEDMLMPYMWGALQAFENYIDEQNELYRREDTHVQ